MMRPACRPPRWARAGSKSRWGRCGRGRWRPSARCRTEQCRSPFLPQQTLREERGIREYPCCCRDRDASCSRDHSRRTSHQANTQRNTLSMASSSSHLKRYTLPSVVHETMCLILHDNAHMKRGTPDFAEFPSHRQFPQCPCIPSQFPSGPRPTLEHAHF